MRNVSFKQILVLFLIFLLLFGDLFRLKKKIADLVTRIDGFVSKKNKKKGI